MVPAALLDWYQSEEAQFFRRQVGSCPWVKGTLLDSGWQAVNKEAISFASDTLKQYYDLQGALLFGSDSPSDATFANPHGLNAFSEMRHWQTAGIPAKEILRAATIANAEFFNLADKIGSIEEGKQADLLILKENPLLDIEALASIENVILDGKVLKRDSLSALHIK